MSDGLGRQDVLIVVATLAVFALISLGLLKLVGGWLDDAGYTDEELDRVARVCEERARTRASSVGLSVDEFYERCERSMKIQIDPDPWLK